MQLLGALGIDWKVFLIQAINFLLLFFILKWLFFKPFIKAVQEEKQKSEEMKNAQEEIKRQQEEIKKQEEEMIRQAKEKTRQIIEEGEGISREEKERILKRAEEEAKQILEISKEKAKVEVEKSKEEEKKRIVEIAEKIIKKAINASFNKKLHNEFLREAIDELKSLDFEKLKDKEIVQVTVISAFLLEEEERKEISDFLFSKIRNLSFREKIDPSLLAGVRILMDDYSIDISLKSKIYKSIQV